METGVPKRGGGGGGPDTWEKFPKNPVFFWQRPLTYKTFSETWHFPKAMPQLDGEGGEGDNDAGDSDATIHDLDEQADLSVNLDAEELNMEANNPAQSMEGVKIQVGI